jgi:hypothetical protein
MRSVPARTASRTMTIRIHLIVWPTRLPSLSRPFGSTIRLNSLPLALPDPPGSQSAPNPSVDDLVNDDRDRAPWRRKRRLCVIDASCVRYSELAPFDGLIWPHL